jgi:hypothetical protein
MVWSANFAVAMPPGVRSGRRDKPHLAVAQFHRMFAVFMR